MSRCFPYPPPGYSLNTASNETLIESIKLQKEREKAKAERKKEKKEKKREKKDKKREREKTKHQSTSLGFDEAVHKGSNSELKKRYNVDEAELLERSNLTEEHGQPVSSQNSSHSSDSTQNSNKRKKPVSPSNGIHANGSIIRIRLASLKHGQTETSATKEVCFSKPAQQEAEVAVRSSAERTAPLSKSANNQGFPSVRSSAERTAPLSKFANNQGFPSVRSSAERTAPLSKSASNQRFPSVSVPEPSPSTSARAERVTEDKASAASCSKVHENSIEFQYKNLIGSWIPPKIQCEQLDFDDQDWLFQRKHKRPRVEEKGGVETCSSSAMWPQAQYLRDAEIYALPFTIPF